MTPRRMQMMMMMRSSRPPQHRLLLLLVILAISSFPLHRSSVNAQDTTSSSSSSPPSYANHVPISYKVNQKQTECIYDIFQQDEQVTFSVFIVEALKNGKPLCNVLIEGPINAQTQQDNNDRRMSLGRMIRQGLLENQQFTKDNANILKYNMKVDWTHAGEEEDKLLIRQEIERNNSKQRQKYQESSSSNDPYHKPISTYAMSKIEPFEMTRVIPETGYYRVCAQAGLHALVVEMDARSELRMGGVDQVTGHVFTYAKRDLRNEEAAIDNSNNNNKKVWLLLLLLLATTIIIIRTKVTEHPVVIPLVVHQPTLVVHHHHSHPHPVLQMKMISTSLLLRLLPFHPTV
mmetsp:Transcript_10280/g.16993  ORF Transcript_10280/g.16993 Transcript_10280/m.16993 type:complete len:346 (+) Transcript_10280:90-1127(+)